GRDLKPNHQRRRTVPTVPYQPYRTKRTVPTESPEAYQPNRTKPPITGGLVWFGWYASGDSVGTVRFGAADGSVLGRDPGACRF
ncbi:hypothetical protein BpHYR1_016084, partial [Brachionus plicatilis]